MKSRRGLGGASRWASLFRSPSASRLLRWRSMIAVVAAAAEPFVVVVALLAEFDCPAVFGQATYRLRFAHAFSAIYCDSGA